MNIAVQRLRLRHAAADTAGIRRKSRVEEDIEFYSVMRSIRAIEDSDVCILTIDAQDGVQHQDRAHLPSIIERQRQGRGGAGEQVDLMEKGHPHRQGLRGDRSNVWPLHGRARDLHPRSPTESAHPQAMEMAPRKRGLLRARRAHAQAERGERCLSIERHPATDVQGQALCAPSSTRPSCPLRCRPSRVFYRNSPVREGALQALSREQHQSTLLSCGTCEDILRKK